jgi:hypothetical protein
MLLRVISFLMLLHYLFPDAFGFGLVCCPTIFSFETRGARCSNPVVVFFFVFFVWNREHAACSNAALNRFFHSFLRPGLCRTLIR